MINQLQYLQLQIYFSSNPLLPATDIMSTQKYYIKILIIQKTFIPAA